MAFETKYGPEMLEKAKECAASGMTDREIALELEVHLKTIYQWKKKYPKFKEALQIWKYIADQKVERSLYERATGYDFVEEKLWCNQNGEVTRVETVKHVPPDIKAIIFWLKNRQPDTWKDKTETEHSGKVDLAQSILEARKRSQAEGDIFE